MTQFPAVVAPATLLNKWTQSADIYAIVNSQTCACDPKCQLSKFEITMQFE